MLHFQTVIFEKLSRNCILSAFRRKMTTQTSEGITRIPYSLLASLYIGFYPAWIYLISFAARVEHSHTTVVIGITCDMCAGSLLESRESAI